MEHSLQQQSSKEEEYSNVSEEELNALLGKDVLEKLLQQQVGNNKNEIQVTEKNNVEFVNNKSKDLTNQIQETISTVLAQVQSTPDDDKLLTGASSLIKAQTALLTEINKANLLEQKFQYQLKLQQMKNSSDAKINRENNQTKILLSRSEMFRKVMEQAKKKKEEDDDVIDVGS